MRFLIFGCLVGAFFVSPAQFFSGYYVSDPQLEGFHHFKIKHDHGDAGKYEGVFNLKGYMHKDVLWDQEAVTIHGEEADYFIEKYGEERNILSVHEMKMMWDGNEFVVVMLGYLDEKDHGRFVVVEEIFNDESETELLEVKQYHWVKGRHILANNDY
jgi:hypothetical protein